MNEVNPHWDIPTVHPVYLRLCFQTLRSQGVEVAPLLLAAGLHSWEALMRHDAPVSYRVIHALIQQVLALRDQATLALELGASVPVSAHGPLGYAVVASRDLRQALQTLERYTSLRSANFTYRFTETGPGFCFELVDLIGRDTWVRERDFFVTLMFMLIVRMLEAVGGPCLASFSVDIPFSEPPWQGEIQRRFPGTLRFGAPRLAFHGDAAVLGLPCVTADPWAYTQACQECDRLLAQSRNASVRTRLASLLASRPGNYPSLKASAHFFHMSSRTLARRLVAEGTSFQTLVDDARRQKAQWYLLQTTLTVEDIALRLGYGNVSSFSRVCRRWFGATPSELRQRETAG